jgi:cell division protein FtsW (lipid II flippase)
MLRRDTLSAGLPACAPLPALLIGVVAMPQLGVSTTAWVINVGATIFGLLLWALGRRWTPPIRQTTRLLLTTASIAMLLLPLASEGMLGVHRWVSVAGLQLHAAAIAAPLIILCVTAAASRWMISALAISATSGIILALQPDSAQAISLAAACAVVLVCAGTKQRSTTLLGVALLVVVSTTSFIRRDPLPPVAHVEGIFEFIASRGPWHTATASLALVLLPAPFFVAWYRQRRPIALALGVYITMIALAPSWGTFPVPVMGYGASPILGYFIALVVGLGRSSHIEAASEETSSPSSSA